MKTHCSNFSYLFLIFIFFSNCSLGQENKIKDGASNNPILYLYADQLPSFVGGNKKLKEFIDSNIKWPTEFDGAGTVIISFIVKKDGSIYNAKIEKSLQFLCDAEALRVINLMPKWKSGKLNDKPVDIIIYLPIKFVLH